MFLVPAGFIAGEKIKFQIITSRSNHFLSLWNEVEDNRYQNFNGVFLCQYFIFLQEIHGNPQDEQIPKLSLDFQLEPDL